MPELPEVEIFRRQLQSTVVGKQIAQVACRQPKALNMPLEEFARCVRGQAVKDALRRAKSAILALDRGSLWLHLGLQGRPLYLPQAPDEVPGVIVFHFADGAALGMDKLFMGHAHFVPPEEFAGRWEALGSEPLAADFTAERLGQVLAAKPQAELKPRLMDQEALAGIGNVYSDEILHRAGLHPARAAGSLSGAELGTLHWAMQEILAEAIDTGGDYTDMFGRQGLYPMRIHGRQDCAACGAPSQKARFQGRTGYFCPRCQPLPAGKGQPPR